jgi:hypothetical protein
VLGWPSLGVVLGGVLPSHTVSGAVPSALKGLTSGFGMGPGVSHFAMAAVTSFLLCFFMVVYVWCVCVFRSAQWTRSLFVFRPRVGWGVWSSRSAY